MNIQMRTFLLAAMFKYVRCKLAIGRKHASPDMYQDEKPGGGLDRSMLGGSGGGGSIEEEPPKVGARYSGGVPNSNGSF